MSVMRSFPNFIPLSASEVKRIKSQLSEWSFSRLYGPFWEYEIKENAKDVVDWSLDRYLKALEG